MNSLGFICMSGYWSFVMSLSLGTLIQAFWVNLSMQGFPWDTTITSHLPEHKVGEVSQTQFKAHEVFNSKGLISIGFYLLLRLSLLSSGSHSEVFLFPPIKQEQFCAVSDLALLIVILHYILSINAASTWSLNEVFRCLWINPWYYSYLSVCHSSAYL